MKLHSEKPNTVEGNFLGLPLKWYIIETDKVNVHITFLHCNEIRNTHTNYAPKFFSRITCKVDVLNVVPWTRGELLTVFVPYFLDFYGDAEVVKY